MTVLNLAISKWRVCPQIGTSNTEFEAQDSNNGKKAVGIYCWKWRKANEIHYRSSSLGETPHLRNSAPHQFKGWWVSVKKTPFPWRWVTQFEWDYLRRSNRGYVAAHPTLAEAYMKSTKMDGASAETAVSCPLPWSDHQFQVATIKSRTRLRMKVVHWFCQGSVKNQNIAKPHVPLLFKRMTHCTQHNISGTEQN